MFADHVCIPDLLLMAAYVKPGCLTQGWSLMLIGPFLDRYVAQDWVFRYNWTTAALVCLTVSCSLAVGVNLSQFACLGRFSAVSYQVPLPQQRSNRMYHSCAKRWQLIPELFMWRHQHQLIR